MPYKDRGRWRGVVRINGRRVSATFQTKAEAKSWEVGTKAEMRRPTFERLGLFELAAKYLQFVAQNQAKKTFSMKIQAILGPRRQGE